MDQVFSRFPVALVKLQINISQSPRSTQSYLIVLRELSLICERLISLNFFFLRSESIPLFHSKIRVSYFIRLVFFQSSGAGRESDQNGQDLINGVDCLFTFWLNRAIWLYTAKFNPDYLFFTKIVYINIYNIIGVLGE